MCLQSQHRAPSPAEQHVEGREVTIRRAGTRGVKKKQPNMGQSTAVRNRNIGMACSAQMTDVLGHPSIGVLGAATPHPAVMASTLRFRTTPWDAPCQSSFPFRAMSSLFLQMAPSSAPAKSKGEDMRGACHSASLQGRFDSSRFYTFTHPACLDDGCMLG
jgi:hypothetical protein